MRLNAANLLFKKKYYQDSIVLYWQLIREYIFEFLEKNDIEYDSTKEALCKINKYFYNDIDFTSKVIFFDTIATLSEWDRKFILTEEQGLEMKDLFLEIIQKLK